LNRFGEFRIFDEIADMEGKIWCAAVCAMPLAVERGAR
jgi:hypothetical protein